MWIITYRRSHWDHDSKRVVIKVEETETFEDTRSAYYFEREIRQDPWCEIVSVQRVEAHA